MEKVKLKDICSMQSGGTPSRSKSEFYTGNIPWAKISDLEKSNDGYIYETEEHITEEALKSINNRFFKVGTLLLAMYGSVGKTAIAKIDLSTNQAILGINIIDKNNVDIKYLRYWFTTIKEQLLNRAVGAALANISLGIVKELEIPLPSIANQQRIATILDQADFIIQNNRAIVQKYDTLTQSLFLDMFGDPVKNEKGWEKVRFDELVSKDCPLTYGIVQPGEEFEDGIPCVRPVDLTSQYIYVDELKRIDPKISSKFNRTLLKGGELLLSVRGSVGIISIADSSLNGSNVTRGIVPIWFNSEISNKLFFYYLYCTKEIQREVKALAKGATLIQINLKDLRELKIIKPPIQLQNQFAERVAVIEAQKQQAQLALAKSEELFASLLQRAFKGEL